MQKDKLINLTRKLSKFGRNKTASDIYTKLTKDVSYNEFYSVMTAEDIILLCFMIPKYESDLDSLYDEIKSNLFAFNTITVDNMEPMETCSYCGGDGEISCGDCGGDGEIECPDCGGDGEDSEGEPCNTCQGGGEVRCDECHRGLIQCDNCNGSGEVEIDDSVEATLYIFISYDRNVRQKVELLNEFDKIELSELIPNFYETILLRSESDVTSMLPDPEDGDEYMYEFADYELTLRKAKTYIAVDSLNGIF